MLNLQALDLQEQKTYRNPPFLYYEDVDHQLNIKKVPSLPLVNWRNLTEQRNNFGHSTSVFWLRLEINNYSAYQDWILCSKKPLNFLDVYLIQGNRIVYESHVGTKIAYEKRDIPHSYFLFPLSLQQQHSYVLYICVASEPILGIDIHLYEKYQFWQIASQDYSNQMFIFGCLFVLVLYNAAIGYFTRNIKYLFYVLYLALLTLFLMQQEGFLATFLPIHTIDNELHAFLAMAGVAFFTMFIYYFFLVGIHFPYIKNIFIIALFLFPILWCLYVIKVIVFHYCIKAVLVLVGILTVSIPRMTWKMYKTNRSVLYFAIGWLSLCFGTIIHMLYTEGYIDQKTWYENFYRYLFVFEGVLFSLALANRINEQKEEKLRLQIELYTYQEQEKFRLQQMVNEQTAKLEEAMIKTQKASEAKSEFLANMSHELRSPLNAIIGFGQIIQRDSKEPNVLNYMKIIQSSSEHLLDVINQVLELSRIESQKETLNISDFDLHEMLRLLEKMFSLQAREKNLDLQFNIKKVPQFVRSDKAKLRQVIINLLTNAIKFTEQGHVYFIADHKEPLAFSDTQTHLQFTVEDSGCGIEHKEFPQIFQPFAQTASGKELQKGTGLGMFISRSFVRMLGGDITVESTVDKGTRFCFDIVVNVIKSTTRRNRVAFADIGKIKVAQQSAKKILIVDDREYNRAMLENILQPLGFDTYQAVNGKQAIEAWKSSLASVVLMDMRMPVMDGYEATKRLKNLDNSTVVIAVTASAFVEDEQAIRSAGCDDILIKPVNATQLLEVINKYIKLEHIDKVQKDQNNVVVSDVLCQEQIDTLKQAAIEADIEQIDKIIRSIPPQYATLRATLNNYVHKFDYEKIVNMIDHGQKED